MTSLSITVEQDEATAEISRQFDYAFDGTSTFTPPTMPEVGTGFSIGLIVGPSGSGKTTLLSRFGATRVIRWKKTSAIVSQFQGAEDAQQRLAAVGLNTVPSWLRPYHVLSTGEQFRADLARRLVTGATIDEFTSTVDRTVALSCAHATQRYIRGQRLSGVVFATCHYDVIPWLQPDWVFDTSTGCVARRGSVQRPNIKLDIIPCGAEAWAAFSNHHYLSSSINRAARCWLAHWGDNLVGFAAALAFPNGNFKNGWREHRTVVLPDYQGLGIGVRLSDAIASMFVADGKRYFSKTTHPRMGGYRDASFLWRGTSKNHKARADYLTQRERAPTKEDAYKGRHAHRVAYSHEYIGNE
jgi:ABC-type iron transport system FetAB ATPase subunit/GNAT superfamily N-acetyltransferase